MSMEKQQQRKLIVTDVAIYWLYTDGSHRCLDVGDAFLVNAALEEYDIMLTNKRTEQPVDLTSGARAIARDDGGDDYALAEWQKYIEATKACAEAWGLKWK